ncbi:MAG: hypothetical protein ABR567_12105 [Myxococcales bacterium]|nr:hypothetical protein [Myxococcales bacterium]
MIRWLLVLAVGLGCAPKKIRIRPPTWRDLSDVTFLPYSGSSVESFFDKDGKLCPRYDRKVKQGFAGWQNEGSDAACDHDTFEDGLHPAHLELSWSGAIPNDGTYDLLAGGYAVGTWGRVQARGSYYGDFFAWARLDVEAKSAHCHAEWSAILGKAGVTGNWARMRDFTGWNEIPDLKLVGCKAGDPLTVRLTINADVNRGRVEVDAFGFSVINAEEIDRIFGIRPGSSGAEATASPR